MSILSILKNKDYIQIDHQILDLLLSHNNHVYPSGISNDWVYWSIDYAVVENNSTLERWLQGCSSCWSRASLTSCQNEQGKAYTYLTPNPKGMVVALGVSLKTLTPMMAWRIIDANIIGFVKRLGRDKPLWGLLNTPTPMIYITLGHLQVYKPEYMVVKYPSQFIVEQNITGVGVKNPNYKKPWYRLFK